MARRAVPALVARRIAGMLAAHGLPTARVAGSELGLGHLRLTGVSLGDGLALGALDIDAGISLLWRPRIHEIAIRGAALSAAALGRLAPPPTAEPAGDLPVDVVRIIDAALTVGDARFAVAGTIALAGPTLGIDLTATSDAVRLGSTVARGVRAAIRASGHGADASIHASVHASGRAELTAPAAGGGAAVARGVALDADLTGSLASRAFEIRGVARAEQLELDDHARLARPDPAAPTTARGVRVPFTARLAVVDGALDARLAPGPLRWSASAARVGGAELRAPSGTLVDRRTLRWRAAEARWAGMRVREPAGTVELGPAARHTATWTAITGPGPIELGAGVLRAHRSRAGWSLDSGRAHALGGELIAEPAAAAPDRPLELVLQARDLELHRVLGALARGRADGTGALDGELAVRVAGTGVQLERAVLRARPRGRLQLSDPAWRAEVAASAAGFALHQRIAATLADLEYLRLAAVLQPPGSDPDLQITVQGRGHQIAQDLDLTINLRGLRAVLRHPAPRTKP